MNSKDEPDNWIIYTSQMQLRCLFKLRERERKRERERIEQLEREAYIKDKIDDCTTHIEIKLENYSRSGRVEKW